MQPWTCGSAPSPSDMYAQHWGGSWMWRSQPPWQEMSFSFGELRANLGAGSASAQQWRPSKGLSGDDMHKAQTRGTIVHGATKPNRMALASGGTSVHTSVASAGQQLLDSDVSLLWLGLALGSQLPHHLIQVVPGFCEATASVGRRRRISARVCFT